MGYSAASSSGKNTRSSDENRVYASSDASVIPQHVHDVLAHDAGTGTHLKQIVSASTGACSPLPVRRFLRLAGLERVPLSRFASLAAKPVDMRDDFVRSGRYYARNALLLDVRSPGEYALGRVPGAINLPLFTDDERAMVGTVYKQKSQEEAMRLGLEAVYGKLGSMVKRVETLVAERRTSAGSDAAADDDASSAVRSDAQEPDVLVYCWRGGMRSTSVGWLLRECGFRCRSLDGGYKGFRRWAHGVFEEKAKDDDDDGTVLVGDEDTEGGGGGEELDAAAIPSSKLCVIGGRTGVGKTRLLRKLEAMGEQVLDLEELAAHRGSVFGWVGEAAQPSNEQFLNNVALSVAGLDATKWVFAEDEGRHVGRVHVPDALYDALRQAPLVIRVQCSRESRLDLLVEDYASGDAQSTGDWHERMKTSVAQLTKRFGSENVSKVIDALDAGEWRHVADLLLPYYDKLYDKHIKNETGTGTGTGTRKGIIVTVGEDEQDFDEDSLADGIIRHVRTLEKNEAIIPSV